MKRSKLIRTAIVIVAAVTLAVGGFFAGQASAYQGHMWNALNHLNMAWNQLNLAVPDKAGHRVAAMNLIKEAIGQVNAGIAAGAR